MLGWSILILCIGLVLCGYYGYKINHQEQEDNETRLKNEEIKNNYNKLLTNEQILINKINLLTQQEMEKKEKINELKNLTEDINAGAAAAFEQYCDALEQSYKNKEKEFEQEIEILDNSYSMAQDSWIQKQNAVLNDLNNIKKTRAAAMEAQLKEEQIKKEKEFYSLQLSKEDLKDAKVLRDIECKLSNPRVLRMLIWQTFYREPMNQLCNNIVGPNIKTGIYKITNQITNQCYIGQAVDITKRWKDHAKCGLGIDTPTTNKLYNAMITYGLEEFTWEILEECAAAALNEKEKFYIDLYQSKEYGYNSTKGG